MDLVSNLLLIESDRHKVSVKQLFLSHSISNQKYIFSLKDNDELVPQGQLLMIDVLLILEDQMMM